MRLKEEKLVKENFLKKLYRDYLLWNLEQFLKDAPLWYERKKFSFSKEKLIEIYENFEKETYAVSYTHLTLPTTERV